VTKKSIFLILSGFLLIVHSGFSVPLESLVSNSHAAQLRSSGDFITETQHRNPTPVLLPMNTELRQTFTNIKNDVNPSMMIETLYLYKKPVNSHTDSGSWNNTQKIRLFNQLLALSTLTGLEYYSSSREEMRVFFEHSQVIDGLENKYPVPDPVFSVLPEALTLYVRQVDLTFGDNIYKYDYSTTRDCIFFVQENIDTLSITMVPVIRKGNLRSIMAVFDCGDSLLIYTVIMTRNLSVPGMRDRINSSFASRAEALLKWFSGRAEIVFTTE
jgi:hypothetical protein